MEKGDPRLGESRSIQAQRAQHTWSSVSLEGRVHDTMEHSCQQDRESRDRAQQDVLVSLLTVASHSKTFQGKGSWASFFVIMGSPGSRALSGCDELYEIRHYYPSHGLNSMKFGITWNQPIQELLLIMAASNWQTCYSVILRDSKERDGCTLCLEPSSRAGPSNLFFGTQALQLKDMG